MKLNVNVDIKHLSRVEGHGNILVRVVDGKVEEARWDVVETPRFFEVMLKGKHYTAAGILTARICGICSIGHCLASVRATESAFGVEIPELGRKLRLLAKHGETLQSHLLHIFFLALPDFFGVPSGVHLAESHPELFELARRLRGLSNDLCDVVAGRTTHPVSIQVGGMARRPDQRELGQLRERLVGSLRGLRKAADVMGSLPLPDFARETEFVSLHEDGIYPFIGGELLSTDGVRLPESDYRAMSNEYVVPDSTSKHCRLSRDSFAVGALARFNNNAAFLHPEAQTMAASLGLEAVSHNPFTNNVAQLVECVHVTHDAIALIDDILEAPADAPAMVPVTAREGVGVGAVEVPRGILYHRYEYGADGRVLKADCVIPTTQNNANILDDLHALATHYASDGVTDDRLELLCAMLVRSYDPCISCSVH